MNNKNKEKSPKISANALQILMAFSLLLASCDFADNGINADGANSKIPVTTYNTNLEIPKPPSSEAEPELRLETTETPGASPDEVPEAYPADDPINPDISHNSSDK